MWRVVSVLVMALGWTIAMQHLRWSFHAWVVAITSVGLMSALESIADRLGGRAP